MPVFSCMSEGWTLTIHPPIMALASSFFCRSNCHACLMNSHMPTSSLNWSHFVTHKGWFLTLVILELNSCSSQIPYSRHNSTLAHIQAVLVMVKFSLVWFAEPWTEPSVQFRGLHELQTKPSVQVLFDSCGFRGQLNLNQSKTHNLWYFDYIIKKAHNFLVMHLKSKLLGYKSETKQLLYVLLSIRV